MVKAIVGANWGDEGKGKITDMFAANADIVIRFQGGANAGHTIINEYGKFALHLLPSGAFHEKVMNIIGNGVALNVPKLREEINKLIDGGVPAPNLMISDRTQIVMPYHILLDQYEEERRGGEAFGSTKAGIAPFYSDKYAKTGIQVNMLFEPEALRAHLESVLPIKNALIVHLYNKPPIDIDTVYKEALTYGEWIKPYVADIGTFLFDAIRDGKKILLEGQLGSMKDPDLGIYPMVTSSSTLAGYGAVGAGIPPYEIRDIVAVVKAYSSAVGAGAFTSEIFGDEATELRTRGGDAGEFGATTGRPRRMGWFDCVASRYGCRVQGATEVALTAIDCLSYLSEIPVCVAYDIDGQITRDFPNPSRLLKAKPVLRVFPGWKTDIRGVKSYEALPQEAKDYIDFIEKELGVKISIVSTGPKREELIFRATE
jgi:adenylosuccinate synthase